MHEPIGGDGDSRHSATDYVGRAVRALQDAKQRMAEATLALTLAESIEALVRAQEFDLAQQLRDEFEKLMRGLE